MGWSISADEKIVDAVVSTFRDPPNQAIERLSAVSREEWERAYPWLIASGMALYFLHQVQNLRLEEFVSVRMIGRLRQNLTDNRMRTNCLMEEFIAINRELLQHGVRYCNVKGFTLSPGYCPDPALRNQLDFDFLVDERDLELCRCILSEMGYTRTMATGVVWEFKAGSSRSARMADHFKPGPQRSVELHFCTSTTAPHVLLHNEWLDRIEQRTWNGYSFPVLSAGDQFLVQALHVFSHLRTPYTRLSWLLEYGRFVSAHQDDRELWDRVRESSEAKQDAYLAIGLTNYLSGCLFGSCAPTQLNGWTLDCLPTNVQLWANRYGRRAVLSNLPGTKLYLLLESELTGAERDWRQTRRRRLLPLHRVPCITCPEPNETLWNRARRELFQARFMLFRARFHLIEGVRYLVEARRWKRDIVRQTQSSHPVAVERRTVSE